MSGMTSSVPPPVFTFNGKTHQQGFSVCYYHFQRLKTFSVARQQPVWSRLSSSVDSTILIPYRPGCLSRASCHCSTCKMPPQVWSLLLARFRELHWLTRMIRALGPLWWTTLAAMEQRIIFKLCSLMHLVNTRRSCQYLWELVTSISDITSQLLTPLCWDASDSPEDRRTVFLVCWSGSMEFSTCISTGFPQSSNETLKLNFSTVYTWHKAASFVMCYWLRAV